MKRLIPLATLVALVTACDGTGPDTRPTHVVFRSVSAATETTTGWEIPTTMENTGGPGSFHVRFYAVPEEDPEGPESICAFTDAISVPAGWYDEGSWRVPCSTRPTTIAVRSLQADSGTFLETDRAAIPAS